MHNACKVRPHVLPEPSGPFHLRPYLRASPSNSIYSGLWSTINISCI